MDIRPLTHSNKAGTLYQRDALVEQQIRSLADLPGEEVFARARNQDKASPEYIQEESLVYWIREYHYKGDARRAGELANILLARCVTLLQINLRRLGPDLAAQAEQDVVSDLFKDIFDLESDRSDFLQVRFWLALDRRITNAFNRYLRNIKRTEPLATSKEDNEAYGDDMFAEDADSHDPPIAGLRAEDCALINDALATIDESLREAFFQRHYYGWQIESKEPGIPSISSYFKKDPRTIRNWLRHVEEVLREWRNEERS